MWNRLVCTQAGAAALTLAQVKAQCRVDAADATEDALLNLLMAAAQAKLEGPSGIGIPLVSSQWRLSLDSFYRQDHAQRGWDWDFWDFGSRGIRIPLAPVISIDSVTYLDGTGQRQTLDPAVYAYDLDAQPVVVRPASGQFWPPSLSNPGAVKISFTAGYASAAAVPADLKQAMLLLVGHWYANREAVVGVNNRDSSAELPLGVQPILDRYAVAGF